MLDGVEQDSDLLQHAAPEHKANREIVLEAVKQDGDPLQHAAPEYKANRDIVLKSDNGTSGSPGLLQPLAEARTLGFPKPATGCATARDRP